MLCKQRRDARDRTICYHSNALDMMAVATDEIYVGSEAAEVFPSRKTFCLNQNALQFKVDREIPVDLNTQVSKVVFA